MLRVVISIAQVEFGSAGAVQPLVKELVDVAVRGFFHGSCEIGGDYVFAAIYFEVVLEAVVESVFAELVAKHVENQAALGVSVAVKFAGIVEVVADRGLAVEIGFFEPLVSALPPFIVGLIFAEVR